MSRTKRTCFALSLTIFVASAAIAQDDLRTQWTYRNERDSAEGHFKKMDGAEWIEQLPNGGACAFKEIDRNDEFIEIYDRNRGQVWVRLYATMSLWKHPEHTKGEWRMLFGGKWSGQAGPIRNKYRMEYHSPKNVTGVWTIQADSEVEVRWWQITAAKAPELSFQKAPRTSVAPAGKDITAGNVCVSHYDPVDAAQRRRITAVITHQASISARRLVELRASEQPPAVAALSKRECDLYLESNRAIDYRDDTFQQWLEKKKIRRRPGENSIDLGRQILNAIVDQFSYKAVFGATPPPSKICQKSEADCDDMTVVLVAAMRADGIPARMLSGMTLRSRNDEQIVQHARAEFFVDGIGWIPVDPAFAKTSKQSAQHFGNENGDMFVFSTDDRVFAANIYGFGGDLKRPPGATTKLTKKSWVVRTEP